MPLLEPRPREDVDAVLEGGGLGPVTVGDGVGARSQNISFPYHVFFRTAYSFSSRFLSKIDRYRSYDSRKLLSTREENISSPRGFVAGGIVFMGRVVDADLDLFFVGDGDRDVDLAVDDVEGSFGRGKKKERGFQ